MIQLINTRTKTPLVVGDSVQLGTYTYEVLGIPAVRDAGEAVKATIIVQMPLHSFDSPGRLFAVLAHDLLEVEWQEHGRSVYYVIRGVYDLLQIPDDRLPSCLNELASVLPELRRLNAKGVPIPTTLTWVDDDKRYVTLAIDGTPHVSVPLTPPSDYEQLACLTPQARSLINQLGE